MVATLAQMASAAYYLESQRSFRHPNEYYTAGEEPDGVWWNPCGLFGLADGGRVDGGEFHRLYHGFAPDERRKADAQCRKREALARSRHDLQRRQERLCLVGYRRSGAAFGDRVRATMTPPVPHWPRRCCGIAPGRGFRNETEPGSWRRTSWARCSSIARAARTTRSFIPIARSSMPRRTHAGRQVPGVAPAPGLCLDEGGRERSTAMPWRGIFGTGLAYAWSSMARTMSSPASPAFPHLR